jgi:hypothetical protein
MREKPIQAGNTEPPPASQPAAGSAGRARRCRTCKRDVHIALVHGECPDCAGLIALPLRGDGGRFLSFGDSTKAAAQRAGGR